MRRNKKMKTKKTEIKNSEAKAQESAGCLHQY